MQVRGLGRSPNVEAAPRLTSSWGGIIIMNIKFDDNRNGDLNNLMIGGRFYV